jgi:very-short-patch-repair endonuclease
MTASRNDRPRQLRRGATDAERRLWSALRDRRLRGYRFRRQHSIGNFIVDFACTKHRLIVEADGGQHVENEDDRRRTIWLEDEGWRLLRFWNNDILVNTEGVVLAILQELSLRQTLTLPSLRDGSLPLPHYGRGALR